VIAIVGVIPGRESVTGVSTVLRWEYILSLVDVRQIGLFVVVRHGCVTGLDGGGLVTMDDEKKKGERKAGKIPRSGGVSWKGVGR